MFQAPNIPLVVLLSVMLTSAAYAAQGVPGAMVYALVDDGELSPSPCQPTSAGVLGLTLEELADAEIVSANDGNELGEVERVLLDARCKVVGLIIEIENTEPDQFVEIPLMGLSAVREGDDWLLETGLTRDDLTALPAIR